MDLVIGNTGEQPIYQQIVQQIKAQILAGQLQQGEALPSMRLLAKELRISVITTKRAYEELEREGFLENVPGKGCFVAGVNRQLVREQHLRQLEEHFRQAVTLARLCRLDSQQLHEALRILEEETPS